MGTTVNDEFNKMSMKDFHLGRFFMVLRLDFAVGLQQLLVYTAGGVLIYLFYFWFAYHVGTIADNREMYISHICEAVAMFSIITMYIFFLTVACTLWRHEQKKAWRTIHLMLPATQLEKFLSRWMYMLTLSVVAGCLTFFVADAIHIVWLWLTGKPVVAASTYFIISFSSSALNALLLYCIQIEIAIHAFFLLGGVLFRGVPLRAHRYHRLYAVHGDDVLPHSRPTIHEVDTHSVVACSDDCFVRHAHLHLHRHGLPALLPLASCNPQISEPMNTLQFSPRRFWQTLVWTTNYQWRPPLNLFTY